MIAYIHLFLLQETFEGITQPNINLLTSRLTLYVTDIKKRKWDEATRACNRIVPPALVNVNVNDGYLLYSLGEVRHKTSTFMVLNLDKKEQTSSVNLR